VTRLAKPKNA